MIRLTPLLPAAALLAALGCGSPEPAAAPEETEPAAAAEEIRDETHRFHKTGLVQAEVVADQLGGKDFMPGGNFAEYEQDGKKYQVFFALRRDTQAATFLATDYRDVLADPKFIPHFGGFYGMDGETPTMVFPKGKYVVVITGLELEEADQAGRLIAGYLN